MATEISPEDEERLRLDVWYSLGDVPIPRTRADRSSPAWRDRVADQIVRHLKLTNWIIRKGAPTQQHGSFEAKHRRDL
jgi:hypothetical protein